MTDQAAPSRLPSPLTPWRAIVGFGVVSLAADMVYEGARSITGPLLATLGASALAVGLISGAGEAAALLLRLVSGPFADRSGRYWTLTIAGYALTAVCVPLLAIAPLLGGAGLAVAACLIVAERIGKAVRSPAKSALLAEAAGAVGRGRGFAVHKALDQVGAFAGPLVVAALIAAAGTLWPALAALAIPGAVAMVLLLWMRRRFPAFSSAAPSSATPSSATPSSTALSDAALSDAAPSSAALSNSARPHSARPHSAPSHSVPSHSHLPTSAEPAPPTGRLPRRFYWLAASAAAATAGIVTFGMISYHANRTAGIALAAVPLLYAGAMAAGALAALVSGHVYDRIGARVLYALPILAAATPVLVFADGPGATAAIITGTLLWGAAIGVQDSTVKALVADMVSAPRRATAYGIFAAIQGGAALVGGALAGGLYGYSITMLAVAVAALQALSAVLLAVALTRASGVDV